MAKPKAERWLTESFAAGVWERDPASCWLAQFDPARRACSGRLEVAHFIPRQRVENVLWDALLDATVEEHWDDWNGEEGGAGTDVRPLMREEVWDLILLAAWDPRNGGLACEGHHRRFDDHAVGLPSERLIVPGDALPNHVIEFATDYGIPEQLERFPGIVANERGGVDIYP